MRGIGERLRMLRMLLLLFRGGIVWMALPDHEERDRVGYLVRTGTGYGQVFANRLQTRSRNKERMLAVRRSGGGQEVRRWSGGVLV